MSIFQKLSWMRQMGIRVLCAEHPHALVIQKAPASPASLAQLDKTLKTSKSSLSQTATHALGGIGPVPAKVMCVLESPSAAEDKTGTPLSGPEGELLKKMLSAIGLDTNTQTYVAYLSPWRAPGARVLTPIETKEGVSLLQKRIQAVQPRFLLLFGMPVVKALLNMPLGQARSKCQNYQGTPTFATFAPNFLLKNDSYKRQAWADLQAFQKALKDS